MIRNVIHQDDQLEEVLSVYTIAELNLWALHLDLKLPSKLRKPERVHQIAQYLRKFPQEVVKKLPSYNLQIFLDIINGKVSADQYHFYAKYVLFYSYALVYAVESNIYEPQFQPDLVEVYKPVIEAELKYRRDSGIYDFEQYVIGFTNVYGFMSAKEFCDESEKFVLKTGDKMLVRYFDLLEALSLIKCNGEESFWFEPPFLIPEPEMFDLELKHFNRQFIKSMGEMPCPKFEITTAKRLISLFESHGVESQDIKIALVELWLNQLIASPGEVFSAIATRLIPEAVDGDSNCQKITDFLFDAPMWHFRGHSIKEMVKWKEQLSRGEVRIDPSEKPKIIDKKPGRNDPCPCGSGKKYKHCCGR